MAALLIFLAALAAFGTFALMRPSQVKRLHKASTVMISEVLDHQATKVEGVVTCHEPLRSPYSDRECVYYRLEFTQDQSHQRGEAFLEERSDFLIQDESGIAQIRSEGATFEIPMDYVEMERASRLSARAHLLAKEHGWAIEDIAQVTITEGVVLVGGFVQIAGAAVRIPDPVASKDERSYRDGPRSIPVFSAPLVLGEDREPVVVDETPKSPS